MTERLRRPRMAVTDLIRESTSVLLARPGRTSLTVLGTVLGIAALVATLGIAKTAGNQIITRFDELAATSVSVENASSGFGFGGRSTPSAIPWDAEARLTRLNGVVAAGTLSSVDEGGALTRSVVFNDPLGQTDFAIDVFAASPGTFSAIGAELATGRFFDHGHLDRGDPIALVGRGAAARLTINRIDQQPAIFIGDDVFVVAGIIADVQREARLLDAIVIPDTTARRTFGLQGPEKVVISTELGAAQLIGSQAAIALTPNDPALLDVNVPPEPGAVRADVEGDVNTLFLILGGVALLVGAIGIANVTLVSVLERVGEIGLRRAVGAARRHIAMQFLFESGVLGFIGGVIGTSVGVLVIVGASATRDWTPVLDAWVPLVAPAIGAVVGVVAGLYPSWRAASLEPVDALRAGL